MNKLLLIIFVSATLSTQAQICDSLVPTYYIDFTGANAGTTWASAWVSRAGYCCGASGVDRCIDFVFTVDSNTTAVTFNHYVNPPIGVVYYKIDCSPPVLNGDTTPITTCGVHCLTVCKPGNGQVLYYVTSILAVGPASCSGYFQCNSILTHIDSQTERTLKISPNPFHISATLELNHDFNNCELKIYNLFGEQVREQKIIARTTIINRDNLSQGIYFYRITSDNGIVATGKLMIQ